MIQHDLIVILCENNRPHTIRKFYNHTITINIEAFNEEAYNRDFDFAKKFV